MALVDEDAIAYRLTVQGVPPEEAEAAARLTGDALTAQMQKVNEDLKSDYQAYLKAVTDSEKDSIQERIKANGALQSAMAGLQQAQTAAADKSHEEWSRTLQDMANVSLVVGGLKTAFGELGELGGKFAAFAEHLEQVSTVWGSQHINVEKASEAMQHTVGTLDLIAIANRAAQRDMKLSEDQFALLAKAAEQFSNATGTDAKQALEGLVDGLSEGRTKMLKHLGIIIDTTEAQKKWADSHGVLKDAMTEEQKILALQDEAFDKLNKKLKDGAESGATLGKVLKGLVVQVKDLGVAALGAVGNIQVANGFDARVKAAIAAQLKAQPDNGLGSGAIINKGAAEAEAEFGLLTDEAKAAGEYHNALQAKLAQETADIDDQMAAIGGAGGLPSLAGSADDDRLKDTMDTLRGKKAQEAAKKAAEEAKKRAELRRKAGMENERNADRFMEDSADTEEEYKRQAKLGGITDQEKEYGRQAQTDVARDDSMRAAQKAAEETTKALIKTADERMKAAHISERGIMYKLLFGDAATPEELGRKVESFSDTTLDVLSSVGDATKKMGEAAGASLAAMLAGDPSKSFAKAAKAIVQELAAMSITKAVFETAEGFAALALGPIGGVSATQHFHAAALYGAVGVAAGLSARAIGSADSGAGSSSGSGSLASRAPSSSSPMSSSSSASSTPQSLTINMTVLPGGEAEAGRQVYKSLEAYKAKTGKSWS